MPWELAYEDPPSFAALISLDGARRVLLRKAIGEQTIARALALLDVVSPRPDAERLIRLHDSGLFEDLKHDWLAEPPLHLFTTLSEAAALDPLNDAVAGSELRRSIHRVVSEAELVVELVAFFDLFESTLLSELVRPACAEGVLMTAALVEWLTTENDDDSADRSSLFATFAESIPEHSRLLLGLPYAQQAFGSTSAPLTYEDEFQTLLGIEFPIGVNRDIDLYRHLESMGHDLCELGGRQLLYFGEYRTTDTGWARNFFDLGLRIGQSAYPLLAHRGAYLSWQLIERATHTNEEAAYVAIHSLFDAETLWMVESQDDYESARARYLGGDQAAIIEAYGELAEGTFRRYASLVVALERIAAGETPQVPLVFPIVGDVETQLQQWDEQPLPALLLRFLERGLRNADAHANVFVGIDGLLNVKLRDGSTKAIEPNQVYGRTAGLRSLLDGVDIAMNHASICDKERRNLIPANMERPNISAHIFERIAQKLAEEHTSGGVSDVARSGEVLSMKYWGVPAYEELRGFANSLMPLLVPDLPSIHIYGEQDQLVEVFLPPSKTSGVGRNDPCPCGSGQKYKRCHGR